MRESQQSRSVRPSAVLGDVEDCYLADDCGLGGVQDGLHNLVLEVDKGKRRLASCLAHVPT